MTQRFIRFGVLLSLALLTACSGGSDGEGGPVADPDVLSGVISIESGSRIDSDTADDFRLGVARTNDRVAEAQPLPDTGIVAGYLSQQQGSYPSNDGQTFNFAADAQDFYQVELSEGDLVALQVFPEGTQTPPEVRFGIFQNGNVERCEAGCGGNGFTFTYVVSGVSGPTPHTLAITAEAGGPFRYVLSVAAAGTSSSMNVSYEGADFRPGEAIVMPRTRGQAFGSAGAVAQAMNAAEARHLGEGIWHVRQTPVYLTRSLSAGERAQAKRQTLDWVRDLRATPGVELAEPNFLYESQQVTPDTNPLYDLQWNHPLISLPTAWLVAPNGGLGTGIAVLDTGLFSADPSLYGQWHPDLEANVVEPGGRILDFVTGSLDIDPEPDQGRDQNPHDPGNQQAQNSSFHGTHVAGIAVGMDNEIGIIGVAPRATLFPVRVLGLDPETQRNVGSSDDLIAAINWAADQADIHVINLSLGGLGPSDALQNAVTKAFNQNKLVVAAAGNQGTDQLTYPAAFSNVVGVGAVDGAAVRASYSNIGGSVNLVAPGGDANRDANQDGNADLIVSAWGNDSVSPPRPNYAGLQGTSMAAPHVAGVYALMREVAGQELTPKGFFTLLSSGSLTDEVGNATEYGEGLINAIKSVNAVGDGPISPVMGASPSALQFSRSQTSQDLTLQVYPETESIVIGTIASPDWLTVGPAGGTAPKTLTATVNTEGLTEDNLYRGVVIIEYTSDGAIRTLEVPVSVQLVDESGSRNAGRHYVLLVSTDTERATLEQQVVEAQGDRYEFSFADVEPGEYFLVAGSDIDNNGFICETGEACAEYPVNGLPEPIVISDSPLTGVELTTSFRRPTISAMEGLPRVGFRGYRLLNATDPAGEKTVRRVSEDKQ